MSNQLTNKATALAEILAANKLTKTAEQKITHKSLLSQDDLGQEMTGEINDNIDGVLASTSAADNNVLRDEAQDVVGVQDLNRSAASALESTGTTINKMNTDGNQVKTASMYRSQLAGILNAMNKQASAQCAEENFRTGSEVLRKFASLNPNSTDEDIASAHDDLIKLATYNPVFNEYRDAAVMRKLAADIAELADAEGISEEEAAAELQAAADANPEMLAEVGDEATGEAIADLADAEEQAGALEEMAANASENLGTEVTPEDIADAADTVEQMADELGVEPEELIQAALEEMQDGGEGGYEDDGEPTDEDLADAQDILDAAAEQGISPEEVLQIAAEELGDGEEGECEDGECEDAECECGDEEMPKEASCCGKKRKCKGKRMGKRACVLPRAAYVQYELNR